MADEVDWSVTTFEGNRVRQHREFAALPLREKLLIVEQMGEVAELFARARRERGLDTVLPSGNRWTGSGPEPQL